MPSDCSAAGVGITCWRLSRQGCAGSCPACRSAICSTACIDFAKSVRMRVVWLEHSADALASLRQELGERFIAVQCDLSLTRDLPLMLRELSDHHGPITRLVNNAGIWPSGSLVELEDDAWDLTMAVN